MTSPASVFALSSTTAAIKRSLGELALKQNYKGDTSYAGAPVHTLVPVFPVPDGVAHKRFNEDQRPSSAVIQGKITAARRDYQAVFKSLMREIEGERHPHCIFLCRTS